jgi:hypothetical protein
MGRGLNPPGQEGSEEFTPNVGNRGCPRWGVGGLMEMVVSRGGGIGNPICDSSLSSAYKYVYTLVYYKINLYNKTMKKIYIISLSILLAIIGIILFIYINQKNVEDNVSNQQTTIEPKSKAYYESFRKKCEGLEGSGCCLSSVNDAEQANSLIYEKGTPLSEKICPNDSELNTNRCIDSYTWCSKK